MNKVMVKEIFIPGDEWVYYKLYSGEKTADDILLNVVKPLVTFLLKKSMIDKWFFIRYSDPESHLRVRFHLTDCAYLSNFVLHVNKVLLPFLKNNQLWNVQINSYKRELIRYGSNTIELAESYFFYDSNQVIKIVEKSRNDEQKRFLLVFQLIDDLIKFIPFDKEETILFLKRNQLAFKSEFNLSTKSNKTFGKKYREFLNLIKENDCNQQSLLNSELKHCLKQYLLLHKKGECQVGIESLLSSFIHMTVNRTFMSAQRLQEMVIYDFLYKIYISKYAKK